MKRVAIRAVKSTKRVKPHLCDLLVHGSERYLEFKFGKERYTITYEDFVRQVENAA